MLDVVVEVEAEEVDGVAQGVAQEGVQNPGGLAENPDLVIRSNNGQVVERIRKYLNCILYLHPLKYLVFGVELVEVDG